MTNDPDLRKLRAMIRFCDVNKWYGDYHALVRH